MSEELMLAGRGRRLLAGLIDFTLVPIFAVIIVWVTGAMEHAEDYISIRPYLNPLLCGIASYLLLGAYLLSRRGQTVGKWILRIAIVTTTTGARAPFLKLLFIRALFFPLLYLVVVGPVMLMPALAILPLLDLAFIFAKEKRCLHDLASGTSVVLRDVAPATASIE
jgi:uncharacterized RDD family membrane protein YckC